MTHYYAEEPCEHGWVGLHWLAPDDDPTAADHSRPPCVGGSRRKLVLDYEAAVEVYAKQRPGVGPVTDRKRVQAIVDAALRPATDARRAEEGVVTQTDSQGRKWRVAGGVCRGEVEDR